jgi:hypothetical protein
MKPLDPMLVKVTVDSKTFDYLSEDVLVKAFHLNAFQFRDPYLLFQEEYLTAYDVLNSWKGPNVSGAVVTGYPGIGTSCMAHKILIQLCGSLVSGKKYFMIFVLLQHLSEGLPTAIQDTDNTFVLFTDQGPTEHSGDKLFDFPDHTWALTDSNSGTVIPCYAFCNSLPGTFVVQTTSPLVSRYKEWWKQRGKVKLYVMECVTLKELKVIG